MVRRGPIVVIGAVNGVVMSLADARMILAALDHQEQLLSERRGPRGEPRPERLPANVRVLMLQMRRAIARTGDQNASAATRHLTAARVGAVPPTARNAVSQEIPVHDGRHATFSSADAAAALGITPNGVRDLHRRGCLHAERVGGRLRFDVDEVLARATDTKG